LRRKSKVNLKGRLVKISKNIFGAALFSEPTSSVRPEGFNCRTRHFLLPLPAPGISIDAK
jgi:hypothetical protein